MLRLIAAIVPLVLLLSTTGCVSCRDEVFGGTGGDTTTVPGGAPGGGTASPYTSTCNMSCIGAAENRCGCSPSCECWSNPDHAK